MSVATARNGMRSWSKLGDGRHGSVALSRMNPSLLPAIRPGGSSETALLEVEPELERDQVVEVVFLLPERLVLALGRVLEERVPVDGLDQLLHLVGRVAAGVEAADDRAHARARDVVDRDVHLLEGPDDADVRDAPRAAAAEREPDLRAAPAPARPREPVP